MSVPTKTQKVIAKIQALRAISEKTNSKAERETTIALATKLIAEYQLNEAELATKDKVDEGIDLESESFIYEAGKMSPWKSQLAIGLAELHGLYIYNARVHNPATNRYLLRYRVIGRKSDIELAMYMMQYLVVTIHELSLEYVPVGKKGVNPERESWSLGCVCGFLAKMRVERDAVNRAATSTALVFIGNKAEQAREAFILAEKSKNPDFKMQENKYRSRAQYNDDTFHSGYKRGQTLTVNAGLNEGSTQIKRMHK